MPHGVCTPWGIQSSDGLLQRGMELLDRDLVADLDDTKRLVDREPVAGA